MMILLFVGTLEGNFGKMSEWVGSFSLIVDWHSIEKVDFPVFFSLKKLCLPFKPNDSR